MENLDTPWTFFPFVSVCVCVCKPASKLIPTRWPQMTSALKSVRWVLLLLLLVGQREPVVLSCGDVRVVLSVTYCPSRVIDWVRER